MIRRLQRKSTDCWNIWIFYNCKTNFTAILTGLAPGHPTDQNFIVCSNHLTITVWTWSINISLKCFPPNSRLIISSFDMMYQGIAAERQTQLTQSLCTKKDVPWFVDVIARMPVKLAHKTSHICPRR